MNNFICPHCGLTNIDCNEEGYKTPKEISLEQALEKVKKYCGKEGSIQWFDYDIIEEIIDTALGKYDK